MLGIVILISAVWYTFWLLINIPIHGSLVWDKLSSKYWTDPLDTIILVMGPILGPIPMIWYIRRQYRRYNWDKLWSNL